MVVEARGQRKVSFLKRVFRHGGGASLDYESEFGKDERRSHTLSGGFELRWYILGLL